MPGWVRQGGVVWSQRSRQSVASIGKQRVNWVAGAGTGVGLTLVAGLYLAGVAAAQTEIPKSRAGASPAALDWSQSTLAVPQSRSDPIAATEPVIATEIRVIAHADRTRLEVLLSRSMPVQAYTLADPSRVVINMQAVDFEIDHDPASKAGGLISSVRYGHIGVGRSRVVLDVTEPVQITRTEVIDGGPGQPSRLVVELAPIAPRALTTALAEPGAGKPSTNLTVSLQTAGAGAPADKAKFVVVIDPGHGGADKGAVSATNVREKDIVLAVGLKLKAALDATGRYDVRMTRSTDRFVALDQRVMLSQSASADLFVSLHADAVNDPSLAPSVHGATVYTLSDKASSEEAQALADKENAADQGAVAADPAGSQVNGILADLLQRETLSFSNQFRGLLLQRLRASQTLAHEPARSAGFRVLRQVRTPTVLIELGFLTHPEDSMRLQKPEWHSSIAATIAAAIDSYALRRTVASK